MSRLSLCILKKILGLALIPHNPQLPFVSSQPFTMSATAVLHHHVPTVSKDRTMCFNTVKLFCQPLLYSW